MTKWQNYTFFFEILICYTGTASVAAAGVLASIKITGKKLSENTFLFQGAGEVSHVLIVSCIFKIDSWTPSVV